MKHQPERTCIGCRTVRNKQDVVRLVAGPSGVLIDYREKLTGRAAYVCPARECIRKALVRETLGRAFRGAVRFPGPDEFLAQLVSAVRERIRSLLSVSLKAGKVAAGSSAVQDALGKGRVQLLLYATDLAAGTKEKASGQGAETVRTATLFTRSDFGELLNRELVGIVGITDKGLADALWSETERLKGLIKAGE